MLLMSMFEFVCVFSVRACFSVLYWNFVLMFVLMFVFVFVLVFVFMFMLVFVFVLPIWSRSALASTVFRS